MTEDANRKKAIGQLKLQLNGVFKPFHSYGMDIHITPAIRAIVYLALQFHDRLNGKDIPITLEEEKG